MGFKWDTKMGPYDKQQLSIKKQHNKIRNNTKKWYYR